MGQYPLEFEWKEPHQITEDGWMTKTPGAFEFFFENPPPRVYPSLRQIRTDLCSLRTYRFFALPLTAAVLCGFSAAPWVALVVLAWPLWQYSRMLRGTLRMFRESRVEVGAVWGYGLHPMSNHPMFRNLRAGTAQLSSGECVSVVLKEPEILAILDENVPVEVLVLLGPTEGFHQVLGYRAVRAELWGEAEPVPEGSEED